MKFLQCMILVTLVSCAGNSKDKVATKNPFDPITLKENLVVGKTSQNEVLKVFGSPYQISQDAKGRELWNYSMKSSASSSNGVDAGLSIYNWTRSLSGLVVPSIDVDSRERESSSRSIDLYVEFNKDKVLADYNLSKQAY